MSRIFIEFSYDGSKFHGFQRQNNLRSVQKEIEEALEKIFNEKIEIKGAGRKEDKVHALGQTATFDIPYKIDNLKKELNKVLKDIRIKDCKEVHDDFHERFRAVGKKYVYKIILDEKGKDDYHLYVQNIDLQKMKEASKLFIGRHDFRNFVAGERDDYETIIHSIKFYKRGKNLSIEFYGVGFFRYMVRNIVGALIQIGRHKIEEKDIKEMLDNPTKRRQLATALPEGLYLIKVYY